ncbi:hypothetical protein DERP_002466 [Dermatophagoides pteronyssinus]|uniref:Uncharacterized protein n=1 Tax=Dermatophagoides pteronyssinus TaxID=6956 RepID=A0ABQ8JIK6_DERPT|nr:hypothetical protein DERP_002466 [Dermatophagoides pteronyssinus]
MKLWKKILIISVAFIMMVLLFVHHKFFRVLIDEIDYHSIRLQYHTFRLMFLVAKRIMNKFIVTIAKNSAGICEKNLRISLLAVFFVDNDDDLRLLRFFVTVHLFDLVIELLNKISTDDGIGDPTGESDLDVDCDVCVDDNE